MAPSEMDPAQLYEALASGAISRRAFVTRLTAFGVTGAVAVAFANSVSRDRSSGHASGYPDPLYNLYDLYNHPGA